MNLNFTEPGYSEGAYGFLLKHPTMKFLMRVGLFYVFLVMFSVQLLLAHSGRSQALDSIHVTVELRNENLKKLFKKIEKQTGLMFAYQPQQVDGYKSITLPMETRSVKATLDIALEGTLLRYRQVNNNVIIFSEEEKSQMIENEKLAITVAGKVSDSGGNPIPGVNILVKGTTNGTTTDADGKYSLEVLEGDAVLVFSIIGYLSQEVAVNERSMIDVVLNEDVQTLEEVVVVGYGSQERTEVTGAIGSVSSKDISGLAVTGLDQALQGRIAGVQVSQNSGEPGGSVSLRIRGVGSINSSNEPLYIVDGVPYSSLNSINPNDIDRIDVLKDASSAAIYGSRASNGVVLVTTKRGKQGKLTVSLDAYAGVQSVYKKIDLLNGSQFAKLANENLVNGGQTANPAWSNPSTVLNNDWQSAVLQTASIQNYNVGISGGNDKTSTLFSFGYFKQEGIIVGSNYNRYIGRLNTDYAVTKNLKVGITLNAAFEGKKSVGSQNDYSGVLSTANYMQPTAPITTSQEGLFGLNPDGGINATDNTYFGWEGYAFTSRFPDVNFYPGGVNNPLHTVKHYLTNPQKTLQILAAAFAEYEIISGLKLRSTMNLTLGNSFNSNSQRKAPSEINLVGQYRTLSSYNEYWDKTNQWNWINTASYDKSIGEHNVGVVAGIDALENNYQYVNVVTSGAPDAQQVINASSSAGRVVSGFPTDFALLSYFGRVLYDYDGKYLLSASIRRDGSSKFGPDNKYGIFPAASVGWRITEEEFMQGQGIVDELKLRGSYGTVGNQNIPNFKYLTTYSNDGGTYQYTIGSGQSPVNALYADNIGDQTIRWEKSTQTNIGIDASLLKNKFTLTVDYYIKKLDDLLGNFPVPSYTGVYGGSILKNGFSMENRGIEIMLGYNQELGNVKFSANVNFSTLENKITKLTENEKAYVAQSISVGGGSINDGGAQTRTNLGERIATFYGYVTDGIIQNASEAASSGLGGVAPGDRRYKDLNNDGIINGDDKVALGNGLPEYIFGLNLTAEYKGFDISALINGQAGVEIANMTRFQQYNMRFHNSTGIVNGSADLVNSWSGEGTSNELPRNAYTAPTSNRWFSSFYVENGAFVRIRNVQIGYTLPEGVSKKASMNRARIYVAAQNLFTFTEYTGYDPEIGSPNQNVLTTGTDFGRYPLPRMVTVGINCQF